MLMHTRPGHDRQSRTHSCGGSPRLAIPWQLCGGSLDFHGAAQARTSLNTSSAPASPYSRRRLYPLWHNTTGSGNTVAGINSLSSNTTGNNNTASGVNSLYANTTGGSNFAAGYEALAANTTGNNNTASGTASLFSNTKTHRRKKARSCSSGCPLAPLELP